MPYKDKEKNKECKKRWSDNHANYFKQYYTKNKEKLDDYKKEWYKKNRNKILSNKKDFYNKNKEKFLRIQKEFREKNCDKIKERNKNRYQKHREEIIQQVLIYQKCNKEKRKDYLKKWSKTDNGKLFMAKKRSYRRKMKMIPLFVNPFPNDAETVYHHINNIITIPIPKIIHQQTVQGKNIKMHREECNKVIQSIYCLDIDKVLNEGGRA